MRLFLAPLAGFASLALVSSASATVLTFDINGAGTPDPVPSTYGNRVGDPNTFQSPNYHYGADGGITPNVNIFYSPVLRLGGTANPNDPMRVFGDLTNVLYRDRNGGFESGILQITLSADPGFQVCLNSFDLAAVFNSVSGQGENLALKSIKVLDGGGNLLYGLNYNPADVSPTSPTSTVVPGTLPLSHRHFSWDANPLCAQIITIRLDLNNYTTVGGSKIDRVGIDNIKFTQNPPVPTPGAGSLALVAGAMLAMRRRRR